MKNYTKPAAEAIEVETQHLLADSLDYTTSPAKHGEEYGDQYSDGLVKEERNFWE